MANSNKYRKCIDNQLKHICCQFEIVWRLS